MDELKKAIVVFTPRSPTRIIKEGGSQAWVLNRARVKPYKWLVCTQNMHNSGHDSSDATEPHESAFLLGKISGITRSTENGSGGRWMITISKYAHINYLSVWDGGTNPVRYTSLEKLGISLDHPFQWI